MIENINLSWLPQGKHMRHVLSILIIFMNLILFFQAEIQACQQTDGFTQTISTSTSSKSTPPTQSRPLPRPIPRHRCQRSQVFIQAFVQ